jgi:hypothetical protein
MPDTDDGMTRLRRPRPFVLFIVGLVIGASLMVYFVGSLGGGNPVILMSFGDQYTPDPGLEELARQEFGDQVALVSYSGHDGKFFYLLARDPLLIHSDRFAVHLDFPGYRAQRIGFPLLASVGNLAGPIGVVYALLSLNVIAFAVGTWATAGLARSMGASAWWGLAFPLSVGFVFELLITGSQIWAAALAIAAIWALAEERLPWGVAAMAAAVLCRETALLWAGGAAAYMWVRQDRRREAAAVVGVPLGAAFLWNAYVLFRLGSPLWEGPANALALPLVGFFEAIGGWRSDGAEWLVAPAILLLTAVVFWQAWKRPSLLSWAAAAYAVVIPFMGEAVWRRFSDFTRVAALLMVSMPLVYAANRSATEPKVPVAVGAR